MIFERRKEPGKKLCVLRVSAVRLPTPIQLPKFFNKKPGLKIWQQNC